MRVLDELRKALLALETQGSFAVRRTVPADDLVLEVRGSGPVSFPISAAAARALIADAVRSPFGWRDQTITDPRVRDGWQLAKSRLKLDGRRWNPVLGAKLDEIREQLGLPEFGHLRAHLDKLTIYGPGQFFKTHQDTEKSDRMIGTLVVLLPSRYTGGAVRIARHGKRVVFRRVVRKQPKLDLIAFYSDCRHEVRPVVSGYRLALIYNLDFDPGSARTTRRSLPAALATGVEPVVRAVERYFATPQPDRRSSRGRSRAPEKLVYLLDHQYTQRNLDWARLKHGDSVRALALREAAARLDLDPFLCLADIHEIWQCEPVYRSYWDRRSHWDDEDDEDDEDDDWDDGEAEDHNPVDLLDSDIDLQHWRNADGATTKFGALRVDDAEVCFTTATDDLEPFESNFEGYMGNAGDTLDRWYHRAAIVLWPRANEFPMRVKADPEGAVEQLLTAFGGPPPVPKHAREKLQILLDLWPDYGRPSKDEALSPAVLQLALVIDDPSSAAKLLEPRVPLTVSLDVAPLVLALAQRYGVAWCHRLLSTWHGSSSSRLLLEPHWAVYSPEWLRRLVHEDPDTGLTLARTIVDKQCEDLRRRMTASGPHRRRSIYADERAHELAQQAGTVLHACTIVDARDSHRAILTRLSSKDTALSPLELVVVARSLSEVLDSSDARATWGLDPFLDGIRQKLESVLAGLEREPGSWSIEVPQRCACEDCNELHAYLRSSKVVLAWPMAKQRRSHIHGAIGQLGLPVTHVTRRQGSPYTLVLTKTKQLFAREAELRHAHAEGIAIIERLRRGAPISKAKKARSKRARHR